MKTRHKIPAVFSIYMVDVLCCALGCVILLWQLYHHESEEQSAKNDVISKINDAFSKKIDEIRNALDASNLAKEDFRKKLDDANLTIVSLNKEQVQTTQALNATRLDRDQAAQLALIRKQEYDKLKKVYDDAEALVALLRVDVKALERKNALTATELAEKIRALADLDSKMTDADRKISVLVKDLAQKDAENKKAVALALVRKQEFDDMKKTLAAAEALIGVLQGDVKNWEKKSTLTAAELADKIRAHGDLFDKLAAAESKLSALTKDLSQKEADAQAVAKRVEDKTALLKLLEQELNLLRNQNKEALAKLSNADLRSRNLEEDLATLEHTKVSLLKKAAAAENRFAGIALTGKRVIFLVDMSGSMEMVDENTYDPDKWPIVCDTVASIMRSLPDLSAYQVIVFSDRFRYAFGNEGRWVEYNPEISPKKVSEGLKAIKPKGGTDMHAALQEVFRYREVGLDTVYLFSDGLPNIGEGLPANQSKLTESQRAEILAKHIRGKLNTAWNRPLPNKPRVRVNCVGFFFESPDLGAFLWAMARENDGSFVGMSRP